MGWGVDRGAARFKWGPWACERGKGGMRGIGKRGNGWKGMCQFVKSYLPPPPPSQITDDEPNGAPTAARAARAAAGARGGVREWERMEVGGVRGPGLVLAGGHRCGRFFLTSPLSAYFEVIWTWSADKSVRKYTQREGGRRKRDAISCLGCYRRSVVILCVMKKSSMLGLTVSQYIL